MCTRWILVLIIRDTNKIACWPTIRSRNGWGARNLLYFLSFSSIEQQRVYRSFPSFASPPSASLFLPSVFIFTPLSPLRRGDPPPLIYLPPRIQASRLVYVAIRLFCSYKYLMPFPKVTPNRRGKMYLISLSLSFPPPPLPPLFKRPEYRRQPNQFPRTLYFKVFTFYRFFGNSSNLGRYAQYQPTRA